MVGIDAEAGITVVIDEGGRVHNLGEWRRQSTLLELIAR